MEKKGRRGLKNPKSFAHRGVLKIAGRLRLARICSVLIFLFVVATSLSYAADQALIEAAKKEGELIVYTSYPRSFLEPVGKLFKKVYNLGDDFKVNFTRKATGPVIQMVEAEKMAGKSRWDIVAHSDESPFLRWVEERLLMKYQPSNIGNIPEEFRDKYGYRVGAYIGISSIVIYKTRVPEKDWPKSYTDLLDPKWKGRIGIADPNRSGPIVMFTKFMLDLYGWDYIRKIGVCT
ncbi:ABC transporter substrate-binding protein [Patescibacteria group bacterium]|nr:ABC transporter substrate-binding protein [Patescibacteria group bacterium]